MLQVSTPRLFARFLCVFLIAVLLIGIFPVVSFAAGNTEYDIELDGSFSGTFDLNSTDDLLFNVKDIIPGDTWSGTINVKNKCPATMEFAIISVTNNLKDKLLFDELVSEISIDGEVIYSGAYGFVSHDESMTPFYEIESGDTLEIDYKITFPRNAGNAFMGKKMDSTWTFEARYYGSSYIVRYQDEEGVQLHASKTGYAPVGEIVTERAVKIKGYKPDAEIKSITMKNRGNAIIFVYTQTDDPAYSDGAEPWVDGKEPEKENPKTGDAYRTQVFTNIFLVLICIVAIGITYLRYRAMKRREDERQKNE